MNFTLQDSYSFQGLSIAIENQQGDVRFGTDPNGEDWQIDMQWDYGYIRGGALGSDGEALDVYIGPNRQAQFAYIVKQHAIDKVSLWPSEHCPNCASHIHQCNCPEYYDEDKVMLGFDSLDAARSAYLAQYDNPLFLGPIVTMPIEDFKLMVRGVVGKFDAPYLVDGSHPVLDNASLAGAPKNDFIASIDRLLTFKDIKQLFLSNLSASNIIEARANESVAVLVDESSNLKERSTALHFLTITAPDVLLEAQLDDSKAPQLSAALEQIDEYSEQTLFFDASPAMKKMTLVGEYPILKDKITYAAEQFNRVSDYQNLPEFKAYTEAKNKLIAFRSSTRFKENSYRHKEHRELIREREATESAYVAVMERANSDINEAGTELINGLMSLSPVKEKQAKKWAKSVTITTSALRFIKREYSITKFRKDLADFYQLCQGAIPYLKVDVHEPEKRGRVIRASAQPENYTYFLGTGVQRSATFHEMTHILEMNPRIKAGANSFLRRRAAESQETEPEKLSVLTGSNFYEEDELAYKDNFHTPYQGKVYSDNFTEIFTTLTQELATPNRAALLQYQDPESFEFMMGLLTGSSDNEKELVHQERERSAQAASYREQLLAHWESMKASGAVEKSNIPTINRYEFKGASGVNVAIRKYSKVFSKYKFTEAIVVRNDSETFSFGFADSDIAVLIAMEELLMGTAKFTKNSLTQRTQNFNKVVHLHDSFTAGAPLANSLESQVKNQDVK